ncbi:hypothetical protein I4U23_031365 [Adineta vaga]|nr:hypothetical protein I4U23_031365 [Adineta vaga]
MDAYNAWSNKLALKEEKIIFQQPDSKTAMPSPQDGTKYSSNHSRQVELSRMYNIKAYGTVIVPGFETYFEEPSSESVDEQDDDEIGSGNENVDEKDVICHWCDTSLSTSELL